MKRKNVVLALLLILGYLVGGIVALRAINGGLHLKSDRDRVGSP